MPTSEGQRLLIKATKARGQASVARAIGRSKMTISSLVSGEYDPSRETAVALKNLLGIPVEAWSQKAKRNGKSA